jgi:hypothetical protein
VLDEGTRDDHLDREVATPLALAGDGVGVAGGQRHARGQRRAASEEAVLRAQVPAATGGILAMHRRAERLADGDVHVLVHLLVVDDDVVHVLDGGLGLDLGRGHAVKLADLRRALEHLHAVGVVVDLVLRTRGAR